MKKTKYPIEWQKNHFSIKIFCSIPNIATGILLRTDEHLFIIDPGDGILRDLNKELVPSEILSISDVFITHGHHDHVGGLWSLLTYLRVMNKTTPLNIFYPAGCVEIESIYNAFLKVYKKTTPYLINLRKISDEKKLHTKNILVEPFPVIHKEYLHDRITIKPVPSLGYKFTSDGIKICYGGDTAFCKTLVEMAKDSDLAIIEAGHDDETPDEMHMSKSEAISIGQTAKEYYLVHVPEK